MDPIALADESDPAPAPILAVTIAEACRITGIGRSTLYELVGEGRLPLAKIGRRSVIPFPALRDLISQATRQAA
jgi:excisionase family DNA binding protein